MLNKTKIIYLVLLISLFAISCNNKKSKNVNNRLDSTEVSDTTSVKIRNHFLFVGKYYGKPGIFKYNIQEQKYVPVFAVQKESVISCFRYMTVFNIWKYMIIL